MALAAPRVRGSPQDQSNRSEVVTVVGYFYHVELANDRSQNHSPVHRVGKDRRCTCPLGDRCPAVAAVAAYLKAGGERAPDPPPGYYPVVPSICPICRAPAVFDNRLSSVRRGAGWRCTQAGGLHYWETHVQVLRQKLAANPWLFPPVVVREGVRLLAYAGVQPEDSVLYPGVLREEVITEDDHL
jgi:hypothetical protein